jgi:hypothetical protein
VWAILPDALAAFTEKLVAEAVHAAATSVG